VRQVKRVPSRAYALHQAHLESSNVKKDHQTNLPAKYFSIRLAGNDWKDFPSWFSVFLDGKTDPNTATTAIFQI
jgi:hypothetical protein